MILINTSKPALKKRKPFAIAIDNTGREKVYIKRLKYLLTSEYNFLKEEGAFFREKSLKAAQLGDVIIFGSSKKFDYTVMSEESFVADNSLDGDIKMLSLVDHWKMIKKSLKQYISKYHPENVAPTCACTSSNVTIGYAVRPVVRVAPKATYRPILMVATAPKVVCKPRVVSSKRTWNVEVNNKYVLLTNGSDYETRDIYRTAYGEFVTIDGTTYNVQRDNCGRGKLVNY